MSGALIDLDAIDGDIKEVARQVYNSYGQKFEREDIEQEIRLTVLAKSSWFSNLSGQLLRDRLRIVGHQYCERERARYFHFSDQYIYSSDDVRIILPLAFDDHIEPEAKVDLVNAINDLSPKQREVLVKKYTQPAELSEYERKLVNAAIKQVTYLMNAAEVARRSGRYRDHSGPGARRAMTNAQAQAITANNW